MLNNVTSSFHDSIQTLSLDQIQASRYGSLGTEGSIIDNLKNIRSYLDPKGMTNTPNSRSIAIDPIALSTQDFSNLLADFTKVIGGMVKGGRYKGRTFTDNHTHPAHKLDAIWLYMALSNYLRHWSRDLKLHKELQDKIAMLNDFERMYFDYISQIIKDIERDYIYLKMTVNKRDHQRLLMINGNLYNFIRKIPVSLDDKLASIPVGFSDAVLMNSSRVAQMPRTTSGTSLIEGYVNAYLFKCLSDAPEGFQPLKVNHNTAYIEPKTGLELDFPLKGGITIETDGAKYHNGEYGRHDPVHTLKSAVLRQSDMVSVRFTPTNQIESKKFLSRLVGLLLIPGVYQYHLVYQKLLNIRSSVRSKIKQVQKVVHSNISNMDKPIRMLRKLWALESAIQKQIARRALEKLLRADHNNNLENMNLTEQAEFKDDLIKANEQITEIQNEINILKDKVSALGEKIKDASSAVRDIGDRDKEAFRETKALVANLSSEEARYAKHNSIYKQFKDKLEVYREITINSLLEDKPSTVNELEVNKTEEELNKVKNFLNEMIKDTLTPLRDKIFNHTVSRNEFNRQLKLKNIEKTQLQEKFIECNNAYKAALLRSQELKKTLKTRIDKVLHTSDLENTITAVKNDFDEIQDIAQNVPHPSRVVKRPRAEGSSFMVGFRLLTETNRSNKIPVEENIDEARPFKRRRVDIAKM